MRMAQPANGDFKTRSFSGRVAATAVALAAASFVAWWGMIRMPGKSYRGPLAPPSPAETALRDELAADVQKLAGDIGERNLRRYTELTAAADFIEHSFSAAGYSPRRDTYEVAGKACHNIEAELRGTTDAPRIIVIGAHYDSVPGAPGANDNGSGVAAVLALARRFAVSGRRAATLRFVTFVNEEPPYFRSSDMGSWVYASRCRARAERIEGMISLETIGCFSDAPGSQVYPMPLLGTVYPSTGNFIAFVGNLSSRAFVRKVLGSFRRSARFPSEGAVLPDAIPGVGWSDHWAFSEQGYPALMITDTAPFRYPHYHTNDDTPDKLDYAAMARIVLPLEKTIAELAAPRR